MTDSVGAGMYENAFDAPTPRPSPRGGPRRAPPPRSAAAPSPRARRPLALVAGPARADDCAECHAVLAKRRVAHPALQKAPCTTCHAPAKRVGACKSVSASAWALAKPERQLCASCHDPKVPAAPSR